MDMNATTAPQTSNEQQLLAAKNIADAHKALQDIKKQYFKPEEAEQATNAINKAIETAQKADGVYVLNFNSEEPIKEGYGILIAPINRRNDQSKNEVIGVSIGALPTYKLLSESKEGNVWIIKQVEDAIAAKLANAVRPNTKTGTISATRPYTIEDFITNNRADGALVAYRKCAPRFIASLKEKGLTDLTDAVFRQVLQSAVYAESTYAKVPQATWASIINKMMGVATKSDLHVGILQEWLDTRDTAGMPDIKEVDFDSLDEFNF